MVTMVLGCLFIITNLSFNIAFQFLNKVQFTDQKPLVLQFLCILSCECPRNRVGTGPLCEAMRVNFENLLKPLIVTQSVVHSLPLHISLEFISKDYRGTGGLLTLGEEV